MLKTIDTGLHPWPIVICYVYINDIHECTDLILVLYADDITAYKNLISLNSISEMKTELYKISEWLCANRLSLNVAKSFFFQFCLGLFKLIFLA